MKRKILSKLVVVALVICSLLTVTACSVRRNVNVKSITVKESTMPETILAGSFNDAGIKIIVTYEDNKTEEVAVTKDLIPQKFHAALDEPGVYDIDIVFKNYTTTITVRIVSENVYIVDFYNAQGRIISRQYIEHGENAVEPEPEVYNVIGYEFIGWDRTFTNITENTNVYGIYANVKSVLGEYEIYEKIESWQEYMKTHNHVSTSFISDYYEIRNYHYNKETGVSEAQFIWCQEYEEVIYDGQGNSTGITKTKTNYGVQNMFEDVCESFSNNEIDGWDASYEIITWEEIKREFENDGYILTDEEILQIKVGDEVFEFDGEDFYSLNCSTTLTANVNLYTLNLTLKYERSWPDGSPVVDYIYLKYVFDDEKLLSRARCSEDFETVYSQTNWEYVTEEFDMDAIPERYKNSAN